MRVLLLIVTTIVFVAILLNNLASPPLALQREQFDLGEVWASSSFQWELPIVCTGKNAVKIISLKSSCECTSIGFRPVSLKPGEQLRIPIQIDLLSKFEDARVFETPFAVSILPELSDGERVEPYLIRGTAKRWCSPKRSSLDLGKLDPDSRRGTNSLRLLCIDEVDDVRTDFSEAFLAFNATRIGAHEFTVGATSILNAEAYGTYEATLTLAPVLDAESKPPLGNPELRVPVRFTVEGDVRLEPSSLTIGPIRPGERSNSVVSLVSRYPLKEITVSDASSVTVIPGSLGKFYRYDLQLVWVYEEAGEFHHTYAVSAIIDERHVSLRLPVKVFVGR